MINIKVKEKKELETLDGLDVVLKDLDENNIRHLIRYSGTENKLRILLECKKGKMMNAKMDNVVKFFQKALNA